MRSDGNGKMLAGCDEKQEASGDVTKVTYWNGDSHAETVVRRLIDNYNQTPDIAFRLAWKAWK